MVGFYGKLAFLMNIVYCCEVYRKFVSKCSGVQYFTGILSLGVPKNFSLVTVLTLVRCSVLIFFKKKLFVILAKCIGEVK
jgi:hypothetical protein